MKDSLENGGAEVVTIEGLLSELRGLSKLVEEEETKVRALLAEKEEVEPTPTPAAVAGGEPVKGVEKAWGSLRKFAEAALSSAESLAASLEGMEEEIQRRGREAGRDVDSELELLRRLKKAVESVVDGVNKMV